ncbi:MAG: sigma-70 family RNA polymerase sigma factor [Clostridia bacterium]|nr:sigma-70 family RNA polymerase sigma factor [Clostridia bacterium]
MTKEDLLEYNSLCDEWDELCRRINELEQHHEVNRSAFAELVYDRRLLSLKKRKVYVDERISAMEVEIERLPSIERRLICLRYFEGWSWRKIACELGYSYDHVTGYLHKKALCDLKVNNS